MGEVKDPVLRHVGHALHQAKKHRVTLLRGLLLIAVGALLIQPGGRDAGTASLALIIGYSISNIALFFLPHRLVDFDFLPWVFQKVLAVLDRQYGQTFGT